MQNKDVEIALTCNISEKKSYENNGLVDLPEHELLGSSLSKNVEMNTQKTAPNLIRYPKNGLYGLL